MKLSELIERAKKVLELDGDLEVHLPDEVPPGETLFAGFATSMDENDKPVKVLLCDESLLDAFSG
jgi:hypothetical protein